MCVPEWTPPRLWQAIVVLVLAAVAGVLFFSRVPEWFGSVCADGFKTNSLAAAACWRALPGLCLLNGALALPLPAACMVTLFVLLPGALFLSSDAPAQTFLTLGLWEEQDRGGCNNALVWVEPLTGLLERKETRQRVKLQKRLFLNCLIAF